MRLPAIVPAPAPADEGHSWWRVMCLTGVDYFSTLGYQPGIAALAAGLLSPIATLVLVLVTLVGALPVYRRVAAATARTARARSPCSSGCWAGGQGKLFVPGAPGLRGHRLRHHHDPVRRRRERPTWCRTPTSSRWLGGHQLVVTLVLLALLGGVFLRGFSEAIGVAVALVVTYLVLNVVVIGVAGWHVCATRRWSATGRAP